MNKVLTQQLIVNNLNAAILAVTKAAEAEQQLTHTKTIGSHYQAALAALGQQMAREHALLTRYQAIGR